MPPKTEQVEYTSEGKFTLSVFDDEYPTAGMQKEITVACGNCQVLWVSEETKAKQLVLFE